MSKNLLFVSQTQFGYLIDYMKYCYHLKNEFDIVFLCWDHQNNKIDEPGIRIQYISRAGNLIVRNLRFFRTIIRYINQQKPDFVFIDYFRGSSLIPLFGKNGSKLHLDIRTGFVSGGLVNRKINNTMLFLESKTFKSISIITLGLQKALHINKNAYILPIGATPMYVNRRKEHKIQLLYVGTLTNRRIENTIEGLRLFLNRNPQADVFYTIIGSGWNNESEEILKAIDSFELKDKIKYTGYIPHNDLKQFYENANVGISYIPMTSYFDHQPATKTFEYLMAGIPVIATKTLANKQIISPLNGILIDDNAESFAEGIENICQSIGHFDEKLIRQSVKNYDWATIINSMRNTILK